VKTKFHDRHDHIAYLKACETARRIVETPALIEDARRWLDEVMAPDPHQARYVTMWRELLARPATEIAAALIEDSERGQLLRETRPIFAILTSQDVCRLMANSGLLAREEAIAGSRAPQ
jgi:hypothetical protein